MTSLQNDLRVRRAQAGLSQQELAVRAGISRQAFAAVESGKSAPSTSVALRLARALNTTVENLFSLADELPPVMEAELVQPTQEFSSKEPDNPRRASLTPVGNRLLARPLAEQMSARYGLVAADGVWFDGESQGGGRRWCVSYG